MTGGINLTDVGGPMRILFLHRSFPGQFRYLAPILAQIKDIQVAFLTTWETGEIPGVRKIVYRPQQGTPLTHGYLRGLENSINYGQAAYREASKLKREGFIPDVIIGHSGWGSTLFMKDLFPKTPLICHFEWFYRAHGSSLDFDPAFPLNADNEAEIRIKNSSTLLDLAACDGGISPTIWQRHQFPREFHSKISVFHEGIHTRMFKPNPGTELVLPHQGIDLTGAQELVTYVATGMEPLRGFPQFMEGVELLQKRRPKCHVVVVGEDRVEYCNPLPEGKTYKQLALEKGQFDLSRLHFTGRLSVEEYRRVLWASSVHVYLTYPFILSWSMLEAMSCGCLVVGSDTPPVREVIEDNINGRLVDFFSPGQLVASIIEGLEDRDATARMRQNARETILDRYDLQKLLPRQIAMLQQAVTRTG